MRIQSIPLLQQ